MTPQQLEALVLESENRLRSSMPVEDDRIELKRDWPDPSKARQFAGAANRANGNLLIYIIGIDERTGASVPLTNVDSADWWSQMTPRFDEVTPDLLVHINVPVGVGESVVALQFATDRAPYLVKSENGGSPEREVPMREGTRTRSARRDELLRMLIPVSSVPPALMLEATLSATWYETTARSQASCRLSCEVSVFLEHTSGTSVLLPHHQMRASLVADDMDVECELTFWDSYSDKSGAPPLFGVHVRHDGVVATGPGSFRFHLNAEMPGDDRYFLQTVRRWKLRFTFGVAGAARPVVVEGMLTRRASRPIHNPDTQLPLGDWALEDLLAGPATVAM